MNLNKQQANVILLCGALLILLLLKYYQKNIANLSRLPGFIIYLGTGGHSISGACKISTRASNTLYFFHSNKAASSTVVAISRSTESCSNEQGGIPLCI